MKALWDAAFAGEEDAIRVLADALLACGEFCAEAVALADEVEDESDYPALDLEGAWRNHVHHGLYVARLVGDRQWIVGKDAFRSHVDASGFLSEKEFHALESWDMRQGERPGCYYTTGAAIITVDPTMFRVGDEVHELTTAENGVRVAHEDGHVIVRHGPFVRVLSIDTKRGIITVGAAPIGQPYVSPVIIQRQSRSGKYSALRSEAVQDAHIAMGVEPTESTQRYLEDAYDLENRRGGGVVSTNALCLAFARYMADDRAERRFAMAVQRERATAPRVPPNVMANRLRLDGRRAR